MKIDVWHNIMWSRYKAAVFSALNTQAEQADDELFVYQIAETESDRASLSPVDKRLHDYPHERLFAGNYSSVLRSRLYAKVARRALATNADVTIIAGFERIEYWLLLVILMLRRRGRAVFCDSTELDNEQVFWKSAAKRFFFKNVQAAFCYGERSAHYAKSFGVPAVFPRCQAAWLPRDYSPEPIPALRLERWRASGPNFLYVGRLSPEKRIDTLLRVFRETRKTHPAAALRIVGKGPQEAKLAALARSLDLGDSVTFVGSKSGDDLKDEYLAATCLVLPSWSEPWGLVVNEALHFGCPVVVSDRCGCVPELVEGSDCGLVFSCDDEESLAVALEDAKRRFADVSSTARLCLARIAPFTPEHAAAQILNGVHEIANGAQGVATASR